MSLLTHDWGALDREHREFIIRVRNGGGGKHAAEPHTRPPKKGEDFSVELWELAEKSGFIKCQGSYKWTVTSKFLALERELFGID